MKKLKIGILDQSVVRHGSNARVAVNETIETAQLGERLGYSRFWVSEHHNSAFIAGSAPEILMVKLADQTSAIRIGSGGIMLPNHSAFKVAENFRMLETLFPGRIDLGMGRAPGGDRVSSMLLNPSNDFNEDSYLQQLDYLQRFFTDTASTQHGPVRAVPQVDSMPMQWILSSSGGSSSIAAKFGMGMVIARFINGSAAPDIVQGYRRNFIASAQFPKPIAMLAISTICAETEEKAASMRKYVDFILLQFGKGNYENFPADDIVQAYKFNLSDLQQIKLNSGRIVSGTPVQVKDQLSKLAEDFEVEELIISNLGNDKYGRFRSFELIAEAFSLC